MNSQNIKRIVIAIYGIVFGVLLALVLKTNENQEKAISVILSNQKDDAASLQSNSAAIVSLSEAIKSAIETSADSDERILFVLDEHGLYIKAVQDQLNAVQTSNNTNVSFGDQVDFMIEQGKIMLIRPYNPK